MYESYTRQSLPSKEYRELLGSALCVFNANNSFLIENILRLDEEAKYSWHNLLDLTSGNLREAIKDTITEHSGTDIADMFYRLVEKGIELYIVFR